MALKYSVLATKSPIFQSIGQTLGGDSLVSVAQTASKETRGYAKLYDDEIVAYCIEWEHIVTTRVDSELKESSKLHDKLNHYQNKVDNLRSKATAAAEKSKAVPKKMGEKRTRNEDKLDTALRAYEQRSTAVCNLLEEVTERGWKDLYNLVKASTQWEIDRLSAEVNAFAKLPSVMHNLDETFDTCESAHATTMPSTGDGDVASDTTGEYDENDEDVEEEEDAATHGAPSTSSTAAVAHV